MMMIESVKHIPFFKSRCSFKKNIDKKKNEIIPVPNDINLTVQTFPANSEYIRGAE
jgi:hypothetical protein